VKRRFQILVLNFSPLLLLLSCGSGEAPPRQEEALVELTPSVWAAGRAGQAGVDQSWVRRFGDRDLTRLVREAVVRNPDMIVAAERVNQAVIAARGANAESLPQASVSFSGNRQAQVFTGLLFPGVPQPFSSLADTVGAALDVSWEPDIWGRVAAAQSAEIARVGAEDNAKKAAQASLAGQVVRAWLILGEANEQIALAEEARQVRKATEEAIRERFLSALSEDGGTAAQLRLAQSDTATSEETIARWQGEVARAQRQLELLAGRYPDGKTGEGVRLPELKSFPPTGLPSELLQRRPDLLEAERRFAAATKDSEEADLARFPSFALTASSGRTSSELSDLLRSDFGVWSLGANLTAPILSGGRLQANFAQAQSRERSALAVLQRTVLDAFGEVEQAIVTDEYLARRIKALERALQDAEESDRASGKDYADGVDSILTVLQVCEQRIQIASQLLSLRRQSLDNRVDLHLALGGDFQIREK